MRGVEETEGKKTEKPQEIWKCVKKKKKNKKEGKKTAKERN